MFLKSMHNDFEQILLFYYSVIVKTDDWFLVVGHFSTVYSESHGKIKPNASRVNASLWPS